MNSTSNLTVFLTVNAVLLCAVNVIFTFVGIFLNSIVIISLLNSQLRRKLCYFTILVLASFDLAVVVVFHPLIIVETIFSCVFTRFTDSTNVPYHKLLSLFSLTALLTMTLERYLALMHPFYHAKFVTRSKLIAVFVLFQLPIGIYSMARFGNSDEYIQQAFSLSLIGIVLFVIFCLNYKIFYIVRTIRNRAIVLVGNLNGSEQKNSEIKKSKATLRKVSTCLLAVACLLVCYCPTIVRFGLALTGAQADWSDETLRIVHLWAKTFITLNSSLNCLIFFYRNSALRRHGETMLEKCFRARLRLYK